MYISYIRWDALKDQKFTGFPTPLFRFSESQTINNILTGYGECRASDS